MAKQGRPKTQKRSQKEAEAKRHAKREAASVAALSYRAVPLAIGDWVQVCRTGSHEGFCGSVVAVYEATADVAHEETREVVRLRLDRLVKVPTTQEIWGEGGLTEQIRRGWSRAQERLHRTGDHEAERPVQPAIVETQAFPVINRPSSFREYEV